MHKEIGKKLNIPRSTITRWFKQLGIPSQDSHRITNLNLIGARPHKRSKVKPKAKQGLLLRINKRFFKKWTPQMAYVLGFFAADGGMSVNPRGSRYIYFTSTDRRIIEEIRKMMGSNHSIGKRVSGNPNWKTRYRLQVGSKRMFDDLLRLGFFPNKTKTLNFPRIPDPHFRHFTRGYFDGDGCVSFGVYPVKNRMIKQKILTTRFTSSSGQFLERLLRALGKHAKLKGGFISRKNRGLELVFSLNDSKKLYNSYPSSPRLRSRE